MSRNDSFLLKRYDIYISASVQVPTDYKTLHMKPMIFFWQIMKMQLILLTTREQSVYIVYRWWNECDFEQEPECKHRFDTEFSLTIHIPDETSLVITVIRLTQYL